MTRIGKGSQSVSKEDASLILLGALADTDTSQETAAKLLGKSRQLVGYKCNPLRPEPVTLADILDLCDAGGTGLDVVEALMRRVQARIDERRGLRAPAPESLGRIALFVSSITGELCTEASVVHGRPNDAARAKILAVCANLHAQLGRLEACVRCVPTKEAA